MTANKHAETQVKTAALLRDLKILIVEDSDAMRTLLTALLTAMGITQIFCAEDGNQGFKRFIEIMPDLVITDGMMKPTTGYAMTRAIRNLRNPDNKPAPGSDVPVLMLSGHDEPDIVKWARDGGVTDYIVKPVTAELLFTRVLAAISNPIHIVETATYRGPSPHRRLVPHEAAVTPSIKS